MPRKSIVANRIMLPLPEDLDTYLKDKSEELEIERSRLVWALLRLGRDVLDGSVLAVDPKDGSPVNYRMVW